MSKKARLVVGIILIVLGVLSIMGLYLQTGMKLWKAFLIGLGSSIFTIGLPCLGTFLIWGYKEKEKKQEIIEKKEKQSFKKNNKAKLKSKTCKINEELATSENKPTSTAFENSKKYDILIYFLLGLSILIVIIIICITCLK